MCLRSETKNNLKKKRERENCNSRPVITHYRGENLYFLSNFSPYNQVMMDLKKERVIGGGERDERP
jgi:hypothetical protein